MSYLFKSDPKFNDAKIICQRSLEGTKLRSEPRSPLTFTIHLAYFGRGWTQQLSLGQKRPFLCSVDLQNFLYMLGWIDIRWYRGQLGPRYVHIFTFNVHKVKRIYRYLYLWMCIYILIYIYVHTSTQSIPICTILETCASSSLNMQTHDCFCSTLVPGSSRAIGLDAFGGSGTDLDTRKTHPTKTVAIDLGKPIRNSSGPTFALKGILGFRKAKLRKDFSFVKCDQVHPGRWFFCLAKDVCNPIFSI